MRRYCPACGTRLVTTTSRGGLKRRTCPECNGGDRR
ncbi:zf-TFIIB domain-containing protein [Haloplanus salinarum]